MLFYTNRHYVNNYTSRYLLYKSLIATTTQLPQITNISIKIYYNPYRYEYPSSYINDFIFIWYKYTHERFTKLKNFSYFKKSTMALKHTLIKTKTLSQNYRTFDSCFNLLKIIHELIKQNTIKNTLFSTPNFFIVNKKHKFTTYNLINNNMFVISITKLNFEQLKRGYNFILNPIDFYTDFKITLLLKLDNIYPYQTAWLLNFLNFNYFFTADHYKYKKYTR